jgi:hypothetical protein
MYSCGLGGCGYNNWGGPSINPCLVPTLWSNSSIILVLFILLVIVLSSRIYC